MRPECIDRPPYEPPEPDKVKAALARRFRIMSEALAGVGVTFVPQAFWCCSSCGWAGFEDGELNDSEKALYRQMGALAHDGRPYAVGKHGTLFFHAQDWALAAEDGGVHLCWDENHPEGITHLAREALRAGLVLGPTVSGARPWLLLPPTFFEDVGIRPSASYMRFMADVAVDAILRPQAQRMKS